ncbi:hypothetical protein [Mesorhizobium sp. SP-1A]|uniref:hypothetical protein n=1 Tax=Mesorhizobium sp. SP-1A TaxID=3077840 RepID=UPI0028F6CA3E|nr:hypothetical protein [Mesorhizobium sp. SP-1A]
MSIWGDFFSNLFGTGPMPAAPKKEEQTELTNDEIDVITRFAKGDRAVKDEAIAIYRKHRWTSDPWANIYLGFMSEVDTPIPDLALRARYRDSIVNEDSKKA